MEFWSISTSKVAAGKNGCCGPFPIGSAALHESLAPLINRSRTPKAKRAILTYLYDVRICAEEDGGRVVHVVGCVKGTLTRGRSPKVREILQTSFKFGPKRAPQNVSVDAKMKQVTPPFPPFLQA